MPDPIVPEAPTTPPATPPTTPPVTPSTTPSGQDPVELAKELGATKEELKKAKEFIEQANPVLETIWTDQDLLAMTTEKHNKRLGKAPATPTTPAPTTPSQPGGDSDLRNSQINMISAEFEKKTGIAALPAEEQTKMRGMVGQVIKEMLDPNNNKTIGQVFSEVSLTKLPWYLEKAYDLATKDKQLEKAKADARSEYQQEQTGMIGSMAGGSVPVDQITLNVDEKKAAKRMGISEEDYLKNKKDIATRESAS